ncbi:hypothetical protein FKW77_001614 [Venturia effusa]|uniref:Extracellular membrane protein CFEM domain-containing protein n=1 Tax=Venturia effusa TaxID=50376 RepID=A0A517LD81_9PEZI|nr:hypothetical protein FKW77_001614 [Venturia effusa]
MKFSILMLALLPSTAYAQPYIGTECCQSVVALCVNKGYKAGCVNLNYAECVAVDHRPACKAACDSRAAGLKRAGLLRYYVTEDNG